MRATIISHKKIAAVIILALLIVAYDVLALWLICGFAGLATVLGLTD